MKMNFLRPPTLLLSILLCIAPMAFAAGLKLTSEAPLVQRVEATFAVTGFAETDSVTRVLLNDAEVPFGMLPGGITLTNTLEGPSSIKVFGPSGFIGQVDADPIPLWLSILPPLMAILLALIFREVITALFIGIFSGAFIIYLYQGAGVFMAVFKGLLSVIDTYAVEALNDPSHISIVVFSMLIGGMVALITLNGGMQGIVAILSKHANNRFSGQLITFLMGLFIFFDDYANTLVVGNTMRPLTDKLKISREKLAYLVDSTSAPVAAVAFVTTWIGAELSYIESGLVHTQINESAYQVFINSLKYSFYPILTIGFVLLLIFMKRDFGPMLKAETNALNSVPDEDARLPQKTLAEHIGPVPNAKPRWFNALVPVMVLITGTLAGLLYTGWGNASWDDTEVSFLRNLSAIVGGADTYKALLWSSMFGLLSAIGLSIGQRIMDLGQTINGIVTGFKTMFSAILILILAWCIAHVTEQLHTATYITQAIGNGHVSPYWLPAATFVLSALVSFSTGTSWGTMAIVYPLVLPAVWKVCNDGGFDSQLTETIFHQTVASVLAGAVWGDHVSPISDTTILSSLASSCNHIRHVRTQIPYALSVGVVALTVCIIPVSFGFPVWASVAISLAILFALIRIMGKRAQ